MDLANIFSVTTFLVLLSISGVRSATVTLSKSAEKGQLGNNSLSLFCDYALSSGDRVLTIDLKRKRANESSFYSVVAYYEDPVANVTYYPSGSDLTGRTVATNPTSSNRRAVLQFYVIQCADEADYRCELFYASNQGNLITYKDTNILVTATPTFGNQSLLYTPSNNLAENQIVTFTCSGNVGREPLGTFSWYKYIGQSPGVVITNGINSVSLVNVSGSCTSVRTESLTMNLTEYDNQMVIRCTVQQKTMTEAGDGSIQTDRINVFYAPRIGPIISDPNKPTYSEGLPQLSLTCKADSNPPPNYYVWTLLDGTLQTGSQLILTNLTTNQTGMYTCTAYTAWGGQNYTASNSINITVVETTTPPPTTTTTTTRSSSTVSVTKKPGTTAVNGDNASQADSTTGMIIGIVIGGVVVIVAIIIVIICIKKRKKQEIEEPAEKPRNNRDLVFTGNRPDLVTTDEKWRNNQNNHLQNTSLNNSYDSSDSKLKADGQLTYVDLQFDDKPRSRKPIQLIDTGSTPYADIAMPRV